MFLSSRPGGVLFWALLMLTTIAAAAEPIPGHLTPEKTPQFIGLGFDDNYSVSGLIWVLDSLRPLQNPPGTGQTVTYDGTPVRATFFCNTDNGQPAKSDTPLGRLYLQAATQGHEIGNHTRHHTTSSTTSAQVWRREIRGCREDLVALSLPASGIIGFRAPYLLINQATFATLRQLGFAYDASIEHGFADRSAGANLRWPYSLTHGSPDLKTAGAQPGLWEMPAYALFVPPRLRAGVQTKMPGFDQQNGAMTGLDWNMVAGFGEGGAGFTKEEYLETLKYSLEQRLHGNRAPMLVGLHSQFYAPEAIGRDIHPPHITVQEMRQVVVEFLAYALSQPEVRIVPYRDILTWCQHPVALQQSDHQKP